MKYLKNILVVLLLVISILSSNSIYAEEENISENVMYWGINDGTLYLSPTKQGYAVNEDTRDAGRKYSGDPYIELWCDWYDYAEGIQKVEILVDGDIKIKPITTTFWFYDFRNCIEINGIGNLDTSKIEDCVQMFYNCESLKKIDLNGFYTGNVKYFSGMFEGCKSLIEIDVSKFDTSKAKKIDGMFAGCEKLEIIDVSNFDTSNVNDISGMFANCKSLNHIDLSSFNTKDVEYFDSLFSGCLNLEELDISSFNYIKAKDSLALMFNSCEKIDSIDLLNLDTKNINDFRKMFSGCLNLKKIDLSSIDTTFIRTAEEMFSGCSSLQKIIVGDKWVEYRKLEDDGKNMFLGCINLVGQSGTKYDENNVGMEYAIVDEGESNPGYLTLSNSNNDNYQEDNENSENQAITNNSNENDDVLSSSIFKVIIPVLLILLIGGIAFVNRKKD